MPAFFSYDNGGNGRELWWWFKMMRSMLTMMVMAKQPRSFLLWWRCWLWCPLFNHIAHNIYNSSCSINICEHNHTFCTQTICCVFGYRLPSLHWPRLIGFLYLIIILFSFFTHFFTFEAQKLYNQNSKVFSRNKQFQWYFHVDKTRCQNELRN